MTKNIDRAPSPDNDIVQIPGFTINKEKSQLVPSQKVTFLGFILDSLTMTVSMKSDKAEKVKTAICQLLKRKSP